MVCGEICGVLLLDPELVLLVDVVVEGANSPLDWLAWLELPVCVADFDDISELKRSMADDAAPMANNMAILQQGRAWRLQRLSRRSKRRAMAKTQ
ncbi:hypothetical protein ACVISU_007470 [Bradyrhizobium sp. USDA 4452]